MVDGVAVLENVVVFGMKSMLMNLLAHLAVGPKAEVAHVRRWRLNKPVKLTIHTQAGRDKDAPWKLVHQNAYDLDDATDVVLFGPFGRLKWEMLYRGEVIRWTTEAFFGPRHGEDFTLEFDCIAQLGPDDTPSTGVLTMVSRIGPWRELDQEVRVTREHFPLAA